MSPESLWSCYQLCAQRERQATAEQLIATLPVQLQPAQREIGIVGRQLPARWDFHNQAQVTLENKLARLHWDSLHLHHHRDGREGKQRENVLCCSSNWWEDEIGIIVSTGGLKKQMLTVVQSSFRSNVT